MNIKNKKICIIGLGYVGLPLAIAFSKKFNVTGYDSNPSRIKELQNGYDKSLEIKEDLLNSVKKNINYTSNIKNTKNCNIYIVAVPTPIDKTNNPNLTPLINSSKIIGSVLSKNNIVIYESTVYPGVTEDVCIPVLEKTSGMKLNKDFYCGYSPERTNPGDKIKTVSKIVKVTSGSTPEIAKEIDNLYNQIIKVGTYMAPSIKIAEASKVIENTQRDVNIALVNELAIIFDQMGIDTNEVLKAAATKWNFIKFTPGLVGGHCIGVDPYYLTFKAEELGYQPNLILAARQINNGMSKYIANQTIKEMIKANKTIKDSNILILGVTFKEDCPDMRNTKVIGIIEELKDFGVNVDVYDPWVNPKEKKKTYTHGIISDPLKGNKKYDAIVVAVCHKQFKSYKEKDYLMLSNNKKIVIDIKNIVDNPTWKL
ncbi:MAG: nucleotide sugar dehydrogenase [Pelagibacteraceae bacterium]|jgi:UDP-N-acetyl-D-galactosamine dehydrogenase|nr:nucleotide sugar dehydrogenase [Pelagibacteraceae bacterium]MBT5214700.1 nucleotide sugar dehydrogenase [Pelagibacteraceae bacterium]MBT6198386.1 nucleotide sugar dehydrogenase [Pelagibacteraceae bacterium]MBT6353205.1 nucleotide sugar dehydrogenase [Pelagibacteraceae bacterium]